MQGLSAASLIDGHNLGYGRGQGRASALRVVLPSREQEIMALRAEGLSLAEIGRRFGVSRQRIEQIIRAAGGAEVERELTRARRVRGVEERRALHTRVADERAGEILERYRQGVDPQVIARELGLQQKVVKALIRERRREGDRAARARALAGRTSRPRFSDEELREGIRLVAARVGDAPSGKEYERLAGELGLASMATVYGRFGGWGKALRAAGLESSPPSRLYSPRWHLAACWRAVQSVADQLGDPPRYRRYLELAAQRDDMPSGPTLRVRLGLWPSIAAALSEQGARNARQVTEALPAPASNGRGFAHRVPPPRASGHRPLEKAPSPLGTSDTTSDRTYGWPLSRLAVRALWLVAEHPGSSGRAIKHGLGIRRDSQAWTLLTRLEREGLLVKRPNGPSKAWTLSERGERVLRGLQGGAYA